MWRKSLLRSCVSASMLSLGDTGLPGSFFSVEGLLLTCEFKHTKFSVKSIDQKSLQWETKEWGGLNRTFLMDRLHHLNGQIAGTLNVKGQTFFFFPWPLHKRKFLKRPYTRGKNSLATEIKILWHLKCIPVDNPIHREFPHSSEFDS